MKAVAVLFVLSCLSLSLVNSMNETTWGLVNTRVLGQETVVSQRIIGYYQVRAFAFPSVSTAIIFKYFDFIFSVFIQKSNHFSHLKQDNSKRVPITGIKHINYLNEPVKVTFAYGDINRNEIAIVVRSAHSRGINSTFVFYGM